MSETTGRVTDDRYVCPSCGCREELLIELACGSTPRIMIAPEGTERTSKPAKSAEPATKSELGEFGHCPRCHTKWRIGLPDGYLERWLEFMKNLDPAD